jgi:hypothetical protein
MVGPARTPNFKSLRERRNADRKRDRSTEGGGIMTSADGGRKANRMWLRQHRADAVELPATSLSTADEALKSR